MQYLAEIQKQSKGFMGGSETKLKLLASKGSDRAWNIEPGNKYIPIEDTGNLGDGALVMVNINSSNQVQGSLEPASTRIIGILQSFSRLLDKSKSQEEEIETWKESLTIQSEQLSARELEIEARLEQLEQMEEEFNQFEAQRQEILIAKEEANRLKSELEAKSQKIAQEQERLEKNLREGKILDESQAAEIQNLLLSLSAEINSTDSLGDNLTATLDALDQQQTLLNQYWQKLEQNQPILQQNQNAVGEMQAKLAETNSTLDSLTKTIITEQSQLVKERQILQNKQNTISVLLQQYEYQEEIKDSLNRAEIASSGSKIGRKVDIKALENMALPELESVVTNLKKDLEKVIQFVQDQEEELNWQSKAVEEIEAKMKAANDFDRLALEQELAEEKEAKKMLDETLVGQRRSLKERHEIFLQHSRILKRRQGIFDLEAELPNVDLEPIKDIVLQKQEAIMAQKQALELEVDAIKQNIAALESEIQQQTTKKEAMLVTVKEQQEALLEQERNLVAIQEQINFYQNNTQSLQDSLNNIREHIEAISMALVNTNESDQGYNQVLNQIDQKIKDLVSV